MELQLGLALPTQNSIKGFDLNNLGFEPKESVGNWEPWSYGCCLESKNKRCFLEAFDQDHGASAKTLPLLLWNGQPNEEDGRNGEKKNDSHTSNKIEGEENDHVVGWPPIKSWRKKLLHQYQGGHDQMVNDRTAERERGGSNSMYVKVKMEGVAIGRKINLRLYHSYQTLTNSLISMFAKCHKHEKDGVRYTLAYQDKDGDWMLAGDVPWQTFIETVQRMEILRNAS